MVLSKRSAAAHLAAGRHINDRTGGELDVRIARKHDDLKPGGTGEHVALLEARLGKDVARCAPALASAAATVERSTVSACV